MSDVIAEVRGSAGLITLNRPKALNALSLGMIRDLTAALLAWRDDPRVERVGVRGMGNGLCLPAGPMREPPSRLQEVDAIVVNGGDWGHAGVFRADAVVTNVYHLKDGAVRTLESSKSESVHAVAGIGNPQRFSIC